MIPSTAHFIWLGSQFPWVNILAVRSAALLGGFDRVILHVDHDLTQVPHFHIVDETPNVEVRIIKPRDVFHSVESISPHSQATLWEMYQALSQPAGRANMLRAALLTRDGGVYMDTDTVTLRNLDELRETNDVFCGYERIVLPYTVKQSKRPDVWIQAGVRMALRDLCRRAPEGWKTFRLFEPWYPRAVNNAVFACTPNHPFMLSLLERMEHTPREAWTVRFALGTHLLQRATHAWLCSRSDSAGLQIYDEGYFYPIGPEVSEHWFKTTSSPNPNAMLRPETHILHWYASVRTKPYVPHLSPSFVRDHAHTQPFSALVFQHFQHDALLAVST